MGFHSHKMGSYGRHYASQWSDWVEVVPIDYMIPFIL